MLKIKGIRSWNLNADNRDETVKFYCDVLGAEVSDTMTINGAMVSHLRLAGLTLGVFDASEGPRPGVPHHTFDIEGPEDPQAAARELEAKGIKVEMIRPHHDGKGYSIYFDDPSGNHIELSTDPA